MCLFMYQICDCCYRFAGISYRPCENMLNNYFIPLTNSSSSDSQQLAVSPPRCTEPEYDPEDCECEGILCTRCTIDHALLDEVVRAGMSKSFISSVKKWLFFRCDERKARISDDAFEFPLSLLGWENEFMSPGVEKARMRYRELKEQEGLKEKGFKGRRVETSPLRCEFCGGGEEGYVYEFGEEVVREVVRKCREREEGIVVRGCRWSRGGAYCGASACLAKEAQREARDKGVSGK